MRAWLWGPSFTLHRLAPPRQAHTHTTITPLTFLLTSLLAALALGGSVFIPAGAAFATPASIPQSATDADAASPRLASCTRAGFSAMGSTVVIAPDEWVCGDLTLLGSTGTILGRVSGNVTIIGGTLAIAGQVDGDVDVLGGTVNVLAGARVRGTVRSLGGQVRWARGANAQGHVARALATPPGLSGMAGGFLGGEQALATTLLFWVGATILLVLLFPAQLATISATARRHPPASLATGALVAGASLLLGFFLVLTCLGIPIAALLVLSLWLAWVLGTVAIGLWLGEAVLGVLARPRHAWRNAWATASQAPGQILERGHERDIVLPALLGTVLLALGKAVPCGGTLLALVVGLGGVGAVMLRVYGALAARSTFRWQQG